MSKEQLLQIVMDAYSAGISKGLLYANEQEENKSLFDAFLCCLHDVKTSVASNPITFEPKSKKWVEGTQKEADKIYKIISKIYV
jgi:hypothetical protein